ncbi:pyridoxal kinase [Cladophialophora carrionii CBS 160.54]|uniref:pyridoxal kinase n=1 Tax=Cladophialophora carrionii CBS 160.54 TaxID=1279043 RepID=V9D1I3_9EURO|nr:pyridoxal kinase [Cladophialophora carrionii CBS 160.54]ETI20481.1 pyridoxal kinase [Cladophialophora carrionii CBS 160.54]
MATFVMQALGCEVAAINTVQFSNHTGYRQFKGRRTPANEIKELYDGLRQSYLTDFDVLLSGYSPSAEAVEAIGTIARDLRYRSTVHPGGFFWVLDPVMGDQGRLYVAEDIVPAYRALIREADLILPNQFEAELLSGVSISSLSGVANAVRTLHAVHGTRHVVVTSVRVGGDAGAKQTGTEAEADTSTDTGRGTGTGANTLTVVGSTKKQDGGARLFKIDVPMLDCYFSGTGDMFAALMVARLREACAQANLLDRAAWMPEDDVEATELPLAKATEKVLSSMQMVLEKTWTARDDEMKKFGRSPGASVGGVEGEGETVGEGQRRFLAETKAAEVRVVRNARDLMHPEARYKAQAIEV